MELFAQLIKNLENISDSADFKFNPHKPSYILAHSLFNSFYRDLKELYTLLCTHPKKTHESYSRILYAIESEIIDQEHDPLVPYKVQGVWFRFSRAYGIMTSTGG